MEQITAYKESGEYWFTKWHISRENADELYQTEVTDQDFNMMNDILTNYWRMKVQKLLDQRPFERKD